MSWPEADNQRESNGTALLQYLVSVQIRSVNKHVESWGELYLDGGSIPPSSTFNFQFWILDFRFWIYDLRFWFWIFFVFLRANEVSTHACFAPMGQVRDFSLSGVTNLLPRWGNDINIAQKNNDDTFNLLKSAKRMKSTHDWRFSPCFSVRMK